MSTWTAQTLPEIKARWLGDKPADNSYDDAKRDIGVLVDRVEHLERTHIDMSGIIDPSKLPGGTLHGDGVCAEPAREDQPAAGYVVRMPSLHADEVSPHVYRSRRRPV